MSWLDEWKRLVESAHWIRGEQRVRGLRLRCALCRNDFVPGLTGAATFTDDHNSVQLTVCSICEMRLLMASSTDLRRRSEEARRTAQGALDRVQNTLERSLRVVGCQTLGPAPQSPTESAEPAGEAVPALIKKDE